MSIRHKYEPGQKYGYLTIISRHSSNKKQTLWECECKCGNTCIKGSVYLSKAQYPSCGCWLAYEHNGGRGRSLPLKIAALNNIFSTYKIKAVERGLLFVLSKEQFSKLINGNCHYCGSGPSNQWKSSLGGVFNYSGIDRVDNDKGYTLNNVVTCCDKCNRAKRHHSEKEFISWLDELVKYRNNL